MKKKIAILLLIFMLAGLSSCGFFERPRSETLKDYFGKNVTVTDYSGLGRRDFIDLLGEAKDELSYYDRLLDADREYEGLTNLATLNANAGGGALKVDEELIDFLAFAKEMYYLTGGAVNIAAGSVLSVYDDFRQMADSPSTSDVARLPSEAALAEARAHTDIEKLIIDQEGETVELLDEKMRLDARWIAKGYALQEAAEELLDEGYNGLTLETEGTLKIIGEKPDGEAFRLGIRSPDMNASKPYAHFIDLKNTSCAMASVYADSYQVDGVEYHGLIDMETLAPAKNFSSVTVVTPDSALADALADALFIMNFDEGRELLETLDDVRAVWIYADGKVVDSADFDNQG